MFIQTESTPNPQTLKFLPGKPVLGDGVMEFTDADAAKASPLAQELFGIDGVAGVFFGGDFISVTKRQGEWQHLKPAILGAIMEHYVAGKPILAAGARPESTTSAHAPAEGEDAEIVGQIVELIDTRVRPAVAQDGGDIVFQSFDGKTGTVFLHLRGSCSGCPSSRMTLKNGIENMLRHYIPEVNAVEAV